MAQYINFAAPEKSQANSYPAKDDTCATGKSQSDGVLQVGEVGQGGSCADLRRELEIQQLGREVESHMAEVAAINNRDPHVFADFADAAMARGRADMARLRMEALIKARTMEYIAKLERERGLA